MTIKSVHVSPAPYCEKCGAVMRLVRPTKDEHTWDEFWGCTNYPECRFTYNIREDGMPDIDLDPLEHLVM